MARHGHRHRHHHHHHPRPHHHRAHHHHHNRGNIGAYPGGVVSPGVNAAGGYFVCSVVLAIFGAFCLLGGTMMMATGFASSFGIGSGIAGTFFFAVGAGLITTCCVLRYYARKRLRESTVVNQQVAGGTTLGYGQPGGTQAIVQSPPPPGAVAYGPGGPIASQVAPPGVTIVYGPGAGQSHTQAGFQPQPQQYPNQPYPTAPYPPAQAGVPYPLQPDVPNPSASPPPSYDEVVKLQTVAVDIDGLTT